MKTKGRDVNWNEENKMETKRHNETPQRKMKLKRNDRTKERKETNVIEHETLGRNGKHKTRK